MTISKSSGLTYLRNLSPSVVKALNSFLPQLRHLEYLDLLTTTIEFTDMLEHAYFENISTFRYATDSHTSTLCSFLNRHPTITGLILAKLGPLQTLAGAIHLPNLAFYNGHSFFIPLFSSTSVRSVTSVCLLCFFDDPDIETALMQLGTMTALHTLIVCARGHDITELALLGGVSRYVPHLQMLRLRRVTTRAAPISPADTLEIASCLEKLHLRDLSILNLNGDDGAECDDGGTITLWSGACKSLSTITLHQRIWERMNGRWANRPLLTEHL
ncbi:hypothetical protein B0H12DRAFT_767431 [Mycena haematopus]|nr:hypothetical protein B0H12DRAFT_767431 [Mycena haematopus]